MFKCPDCLMISHHPMDVRHNYCGNCHEYKEENAIFPVIDDPLDDKYAGLEDENFIASVWDVWVVVVWMIAIGILMVVGSRIF